MHEENTIDNNSKYLLNRKLKVLIADDEKNMIDEIISNIDIENKDYEIIGYALTNEEEREKIEELKPDIVITDIFRGSVGQKNAGGLDIIREYSEKYFLPRFIVISYTPDFIADNIIGTYSKNPKVDYDMMKKQLHAIKITERSIFMRGYEERKTKKEKTENKKESLIEKIKKAIFE